MATIINRSTEMRSLLSSDNGIKRMNTPAHKTENNRIDQKIKKVHRDFLVKNGRSIISASKVPLFCALTQTSS